MLSCMEGDSEPVAAAFRGCRSEAGTDLAPVDAWSSSRLARPTQPCAKGERDCGLRGMELQVSAEQMPCDAFAGARSGRGQINRVYDLPTVWLVLVAFAATLVPAGSETVAHDRRDRVL